MKMYTYWLFENATYAYKNLRFLIKATENGLVRTDEAALEVLSHPLSLLQKREVRDGGYNYITFLLLNEEQRSVKPYEQ